MRAFWHAEHGRPLVVGHRGVRRAGIRENTPDAFAAAVAEGADAVELDARRTADGDAVVHHDPFTTAGEAIVDLTAEQLAASGIYRLADVLAGLPAGFAANIEVKNLPHEPDCDESEAIVATVAAVVAAGAGRPLLVSSFSPFTVTALRAALPDADVGLVTLATVSLADALALAGEFGATAVCPQLGTRGLDQAGVAAAHEHGLRVMGWDLGHVDELAALAAVGVDAVCVDDPQRARLALRAA